MVNMYLFYLKLFSYYQNDKSEIKRLRYYQITRVKFNIQIPLGKLKHKNKTILRT